MSLKTQTIACRNICPVCFIYFFVEPYTEIIHCVWNFIVCEITPAANTCTDVAKAKLAFR